MLRRSAEHRVRLRPLGPRIRLRVDLHGVSVFGPRGRHTLIRWEWIESITGGAGGVTVRSASEEITLPPGAFGLPPEGLAARLERARSITERPAVIGELAPR